MIWDKRGSNTWVRPDGIEIVRQLGECQQSVFSVREYGRWWEDARGYRRAWSTIGAAKAKAEEERPLVDTSDPQWEQTTVPPKAANVSPAERAQRKPNSKSERRSAAKRWIKDENKRRRAAKEDEVTYGDVVTQFGLGRPDEAIELVWGIV